MEKIDVLTVNGLLTGTCADRDVVHKKGLWHRTVHVWFCNSAGDLLLQKRADTKETHPGLWDISCAGHLTAGDSSLQGAVREVKEELGLSINSHNLTFLCTLKEQWISLDGAIIENEIKDIYLYEKAVDRDDIVVDGIEVSDVRFIAVKQFKAELAEHPDRFVPHNEEYGQIFDYLNKSSQTELPQNSN